MATWIVQKTAQNDSAWVYERIFIGTNDHNILITYTKGSISTLEKGLKNGDKSKINIAVNVWPDVFIDLYTKGNVKPQEIKLDGNRNMIVEGREIHIKTRHGGALAIGDFQFLS